MTCPASTNLTALSSSEGTLTPEFDADVTSYTVELPEGTTAVPDITATAAAGAEAVITPAETLEGTTTVVVTAQDLITVKTYSVNFTVATPHDLNNPMVEFRISPNPADNYLEIISNEVIKSVFLTNLAGRISSVRKLMIQI